MASVTVITPQTAARLDPTLAALGAEKIRVAQAAIRIWSLALQSGCELNQSDDEEMENAAGTIGKLVASVFDAYFEAPGAGGDKSSAETCLVHARGTWETIERGLWNFFSKEIDTLPKTDDLLAVAGLVAATLDEFLSIVDKYCPAPAGVQPA